MKHNNIHITGTSEGEERTQGIKNVFEEIMEENFPNLVKKKDTQAREVQSPKRDEPKEAHTKMYHN